MTNNRIGVIGGTGIYSIDMLENTEVLSVPTPYGNPSDSIISGTYQGVPVCFLARHGSDHSILPSQVNYRANIWALKSLGCASILGIGAVGSLVPSIHPGDFVFPDQFIDKTAARAGSFFDEGVSAYVSLADPFCTQLRECIANSLEPHTERSVHRTGTYICMEGPQLSSRAESKMHQQWGGTIIGMTVCPESKLAREAELPYCSICLVSDYDCWHETEEDVTAASVLAVMQSMTVDLKDVLSGILRTMSTAPTCTCCSDALKNALVTDLKKVDAQALKRLGPIVQKYM